jgi:hypothetical protein
LEFEGSELKLLPFILICASLASVSGQRASAQSYTFQTLQYPGAVQTYAQGINASGVVVGYYLDTSGSAHGFYYSAGTYAAIEYPNSSDTWVYGIDSNKAVVGAAHIVRGTVPVTVAFVKQPGGSFSQFSAAGKLLTVGQALNNSGTIIGYLQKGEQSSAVYSGFEQQSSGTTTIAVSGQADTWAMSINDAGAIAGYAGTGIVYTDPVVGFVLSGSQTTTYSYPGALQTYFTGINNKNQIVGYYANSDGSKNGFTFAGNVFTAFSNPAGIATFPQGINASGAVVGYFCLSDSSTAGFIATPTN